ncbi:MAG: hypothetical protein QT08_C0021G0025, partial [archaeon GW2011_AR17]
MQNIYEMPCQMPRLSGLLELRLRNQIEARQQYLENMLMFMILSRQLKMELL